MCFTCDDPWFLLLEAGMNGAGAFPGCSLSFCHFLFYFSKFNLKVSLFIPFLLIHPALHCLQPFYPPSILLHLYPSVSYLLTLLHCLLNLYSSVSNSFSLFPFLPLLFLLLRLFSTASGPESFITHDTQDAVLCTIV